MTLDYFYEHNADNFTFYRIPKVLVVDKRYKKLSNGAKLLYGILLDRVSLSKKNKFFDRKKRIYIYFTIEEIMEDMAISRPTAIKYLKELDNKDGIGLIERVYCGRFRATRIYVKNAMSREKRDKSTIYPQKKSTIPQETPDGVKKFDPTVKNFYSEE